MVGEREREGSGRGVKESRRILNSSMGAVKTVWKSSERTKGKEIKRRRMRKLVENWQSVVEKGAKGEKWEGRRGRETERQRERRGSGEGQSQNGGRDPAPYWPTCWGALVISITWFPFLFYDSLAILQDFLSFYCDS